VVWGGYKFLELREPDPGFMMFDLLGDPGERDNLAHRRRALAVSLRHRLAEHRSASEKGVHLWLVNADDEVARGVEGSLRVAGSPRCARSSSSWAEARLSAEGGRLALRLELRNVPNPNAGTPLRLVDQQPRPAPVVVLDPVVEERLRALGYGS
jgi:hypothetical protein